MVEEERKNKKEKSDYDAIDGARSSDVKVDPCIDNGKLHLRRDATRL